MYRILSLLALAAFATEEAAHQRRRMKGILPAAPADVEDRSFSMDLFDFLRLLELVFLILLISTPSGDPSGPRGQISLLLIGLQISRLFGRRILSRWSVLGVLQGMQILMLLVVILLPLQELPGEEPPVTAVSIAAVGAGTLYGIAISLCVAFSVSYVVKLYSREDSKVFCSFPPLVDSENWAMKFSEKSLYPGAACSAALFVMSGPSSLSLAFLLSLLLQIAGLILAGRDSFRGHHPVSHLLWSLSFLVLGVMTVSGMTLLDGS